MRAASRERADEGLDDLTADAEQSLLRDTARALADAQRLLDRSRHRVSRLADLETQALSDREKLITVQSRRIRTLEQQLDDLQALGANQSAALDEAIALVTELEQRMGLLERVNAELHLRLTHASAGSDSHGRRAPDAATLETDLDRIRTRGASDDLTRFNEFVRSAVAA